MAADARRNVPSVDALLRSEPGVRAAASLGRALVKQELAEVLVDVRAAAARGVEPPADDDILVAALQRASWAATGTIPVINATGVVLHTNLGRAPLPAAAARAAARVATSYADLEVVRSSGARGKRGARAEILLRSLTGAEAALVVNNCAAALLLALSTVARGKHVLVSRGELIEIGGEFRIPDIMSASGARLIEVGTTNRTRIGDYRAAITDKTAAILKVHPSNYRVVGFTAAVASRELAALATKAGIPFLYDIGSGLLDDERAAIYAGEVSARRALADGADIVTFSGDKLLGGPQAGCIVGRAALLDRLRRHPITRAVRIDKMQAAALEAVLALYVNGRRDEVPVHAMVHEPPESVKRRAQLLSETIGGELEHAHVERCESVVGGGSLPGATVASYAVVLKAPDAPAFAERLRTGSPSVFCRIEEDRVLLDLRTVTADQVPHLARAVLYALEGDDLEDD